MTVSTVPPIKDVNHVANTDDRVMAMVEKEVRKNPGVNSSDLFEKAKSLAAGLGELTLRQFHARYPLQVKRRMALARGGSAGDAKPKRSTGRPGRAKKAASKKAASKKATSKKASASKKPAAKKAKSGKRAGARPARKAQRTATGAQAVNRDHVRRVLLKFASDVSAAEARKDLVKVVAGVDRYVDEVLKAVG
jgi:hypothetical protein